MTFRGLKALQEDRDVDVGDEWGIGASDLTMPIIFMNAQVRDFRFNKQVGSAGSTHLETSRFHSSRAPPTFMVHASQSSHVPCRNPIITY